MLDRLDIKLRAAVSQVFNEQVELPDLPAELRLCAALVDSTSYSISAILWVCQAISKERNLNWPAELIFAASPFMLRVKLKLAQVKAPKTETMMKLKKTYLAVRDLNLRRGIVHLLTGRALRAKKESGRFRRLFPQRCRQK